MRNIITIVLLFWVMCSCTNKNAVQVSGRVDDGDTVVSFWLSDSIYTFPLDENNFFSGKINLEHKAYATLLPYSLNVYLSPDEDLELYLNARNISTSLHFSGSLGGINSYLKEQDMAEFFDKDNYLLDEDAFVQKMRELIDEKTKLLEAKNFNKSFTSLEKERIKYTIAERVLFYPSYQKIKYSNPAYKPGKVFSDFLAAFPINNVDLFGSRNFKSFLLNYVYFKGTLVDEQGEQTSTIVDYILSSVTDPQIKDFLLTEIVYQHIRENNGLEGSDYFLSVFRDECKDSSKRMFIESLVKHWERLLPGCPAPDFNFVDTKGNMKSLVEFEGKYLYLTVWATWCVPCKSELPRIEELQKEYKDKNISFLSIAVDGDADQERWKEILSKDKYAGMHGYLDSRSKFTEDYMIISIPRFILIGPDGNIISSNAPRPSGNIRQFLDEQTLYKDF